MFFYVLKQQAPTKYSFIDKLLSSYDFQMLSMHLLPALGGQINRKTSVLLYFLTVVVKYIRTCLKITKHSHINHKTHAPQLPQTEFQFAQKRDGFLSAR